MDELLKRLSVQARQPSGPVKKSSVLKGKMLNEKDDSGIQKTWERPWSTEEMRAHCSSWNLAGDAGLLKHLQEFSQNLLQKTHMTEVALDSLLEEMRNTSVDVQNASNALLMLSNNQFVENRVYDDCEEEKDEVEAKTEEKEKEIGDAALIAKVGDTIRMGMAVIETQFDCMEVPASDSEGEEDLESPSQEGKDKKSFALVLEPRNPYLARPLPYLIGTKEFMEDDKIGLGDEDDEEEEEEMNVSIGHDLATHGLANDSGSSLTADMAEEGMLDEDELEDRRVPKLLSKQQWESSSSNASDVVEVEKNRIRKKQKKNEAPILSGDYEDPFGRDDEDDIFGKGSASEDEIFGEPHAEVEPTRPLKKHPDAKELAEELAAKLGAVEGSKNISDSLKTKKNKVESKAEVTKGPKTKSKSPTESSDFLFGPPKDDWNADEDEDSIFADNDGMFSSNRGLFDDLNEPPLESKPSKFSSAVPPRLSDKPPPLTKEKDPLLFGESHGNLFGDEDEDDGDMFAGILAKRKPPDKTKKSEVKMAPEASSNKSIPASVSNVTSITSKTKDKKALDSSDSWLFNDEDDEDPFLKNVSKGISKKQTEQKSRDEEPEEEEPKKKEAAPKKKLPAGAQSFYANGVDPFALGKKVVKEIQDKKKGILVDEPESDDLFSTTKAVSKTVAPAAAPKPSRKEIPESHKEATPSPKPVSLFGNVVEEDDLFAPITSKSQKSVQPDNTDDFLGDGLFAPKKSSEVSYDNPLEKEKAVTPRREAPLGDIPPKGLFGDSGSDDEDIFSCSSSIGSRSSGSKVTSSKPVKPFGDPSRSLFGENNGEDVDIFSGTLGKQSEKKEVDDLFKDFGDEGSQDIFIKEETTSDKRGKDVSKTEEDDLFSGVSVLPPREKKVPKLSEDLFSEETLPTPKPKERNLSEDLFSEVDPLASVGAKEKKLADDLFAHPKEEVQQHMKSKKSPLTKKTPLLSEDLFDQGDIFSSPFKKEELTDDIFGDSDDKLGFSSSRKGLDKPEGVSNVESEKKKSIPVEIKEDKMKGSLSVFDDSKGSIGDDLFSNRNFPKEESQGRGIQDPDKITAKNEKPKPAARNSKDLFSDFGDDGNDSIFSTPTEKEEKKSSSIFNDPLSGEDDLFSTQKGKVLSKTEPSPKLFTEKGPADTGEKLVKKEETMTKNEFKKTLEIAISEGRKTEVQAAVGRKSPPRTLNLGKVIPSPKLAHNVAASADDFFGPSSAEEDKIVQAWMKGHPPPLRDSKVENTGEDIPGYQDGYMASKDSVFIDGSSFFGHIPTNALLHSHGKERARIQGRRRPPSRKIRKTPTAPPSNEQVLEEEQVGSTEAVSSATPASKGSIEEDSRSQETVEEWSTPEAGLVSPPSVPPRSNPLSPSTDEEQDFFDVLPVGRYPPPMGPPQLSPFTDALNPSAQDGMSDHLWDKEDSGLFEDAGDIMGQKEYDSLWDSPVSGFPPSVPPALGDSTKRHPLPSEDLFSDSVPKESAIKSPDKLKEDRVEVGDLFEDLGKDASKESGSMPTAPTSSVSKESVAKEENKGLKKERKKSSSKVGDLEDLWGDGFSSSSKVDSDLFSKDNVSVGDSDNLFLEKEDLFNSSKVSSTKGSDKVNLGITGAKNIGKSLSKLPPKTKQSLFDDDEEEEDLFSSRPAKQASSKSSAPAKKLSSVKSAKEQKTKSATVTSKSGSSEDLFEDPLMVLKRKEYKCRPQLHLEGIFLAMIFLKEKIFKPLQYLQKNVTVYLMLFYDSDLLLDIICDKYLPTSRNNGPLKFNNILNMERKGGHEVNGVY
ncbi:hypothetical protein J437_LFUL002664 [Ladona fulva]|uniref:FAM21/CAPZIP domain-containing protein n=1 Tax=Ladona fulva TaxID=123851 RepID=A0A8K0NWE8_LADFU|nr:hypothetical protein J437_LFUL002664 [Ladona fulva]